MQGALELTGAGEFFVQPTRGFERIGNRGIVVDEIGAGALAADVERHDGAELAGILDRLDVAEHEAGRGIDRSFDALSVIGFDPLEIEADQLRRRQFPGKDRAVNVGNGCLFEMERRRSCERPQTEQR